MRWLHDILQHSQLTKRLKALEFQTGLTAVLVYKQHLIWRVGRLTWHCLSPCEKN